MMLNVETLGSLALPYVTQLEKLEYIWSIGGRIYDYLTRCFIGYGIDRELFTVGAMSRLATLEWECYVEDITVINQRQSGISTSSRKYDRRGTSSTVIHLSRRRPCFNVSSHDQVLHLVIQ